MRIEKVITRRSYCKRASYDLVYEWEDVFCKELHAELKHTNKWIGNHYASCIAPYIVKKVLGRHLSLIFDMTPIGLRGENSSNVIPLIIDFFLSESDLPQFYEEHNKQPLILISSKEVFDFLTNHGCPLNIKHLALSLPDKYAINENSSFEKKYDFALMGRQNEVMRQWLYKYLEEEPDLYYVFRQDKGQGMMFYTNKGECLGEMSSRIQYMRLLQQSKCGLYSVPGLDGDCKQTNGFHQLTPRFLELIASGCHVIARYVDNSDTDYYKVRDICPNITTYEEFRERMDFCRRTPVNMLHYSDYLSNHVTSARVNQLMDYINLL